MVLALGIVRWIFCGWAGRQSFVLAKARTIYPNDLPATNNQLRSDEEKQNKSRLPKLFARARPGESLGGT